VAKGILHEKKEPHTHTQDLMMTQPAQIALAVSHGDLQALQEGLPNGRPTNDPVIHGFTLLHLVAQTSHTHVLDWLMTFPLDIRRGRHDGTTPLMRACLCRQADMIHRFLAHGARLEDQTVKRWTALHLLCSQGWVQGVALLLSYGANPDARDMYFRLPDQNIRLDASDQDRLDIKNLIEAARHPHGCGLK
jgi:ankyrin repeat protein